MVSSSNQPNSLSRRRIMESSAAAILAVFATETTQGQVATPEPEATPTLPPFSLQVFPERVRFDERFEIWAIGLEPGESVELESRFEDGVGSLWVATATYQADDFGAVNVSGTVPDEGMFAAADSMGVIWAAISRSWIYAPNYAGDEYIDLTCTRSNEVATARVTRSFPQPLPAPVDVREKNGLIGRWYANASGSQSPAIILIGGSEGGLSSYLDCTARLLQSDGYGVLALAYHNFDPLPKTMNRIPLEYFGQGISWLQDQEGVDSDRIGMMGYSRGGEGALLVASRYPEIRSVVSVSGSGLVFPDPWIVEPTPAWTWQGQDIPYLRESLYTDVVIDFDAEYAEIPVEAINGPILLLAEADDDLWPSEYLSQVAKYRLDKFKHPFADQLLIYPGAGHSLMPSYQPVSPIINSNYRGLAFGGSLESSAAAWSSAWEATKQHFASSLKF